MGSLGSGGFGCRWQSGEHGRVGGNHNDKTRDTFCGRECLFCTGFLVGLKVSGEVRCGQFYVCALFVCLFYDEASSTVLNARKHSLFLTMI